MAQNSFALMTNLGRSKEAAAIANGTAVVITHIAIGDGATVPSGGETALYNEIARKSVSGHGTVVGASNVAYFDIFLEASEGPYTIREAGLIDQDGDLIAIARYDPPINKPIPTSGQTVEGTVRLEIAFSNISSITVVVDPSLKVAFQRLTRLPWLPVLSMTLTEPPSTPVVGDVYLVPTGGVGAWSGQSGKIAEYTSAGWGVITPPDGHGVSLPDGRVFIRINGVYVEWLASRDWVAARKTPIAQLNSLPWLPVKSMTLTAPPATPAEGDLYVVATSATGAWAGKAGQIAEWSSAAWAFSVTSDGHGISLPDGRVFEKIGGTYIEKLALDTQSGKWSYAVAGGTANALTVELVPAPSAYNAGMTVRLKLVSTNTGAATLNVSGLGAKPILRPNGAEVIAGDLSLGGVIQLVYDGQSFAMTGLSQASGVAQYFSTPGAGTVTVPQGCTCAEVELWGGGGGGFGAIGYSGAGGGGGGYAFRRISGLVPGSVQNFVVGSAGVAGTGALINGTAGGTTSWGAVFSATGGAGGGGNSNNATGGGNFTSADFGIVGQTGGPGQYETSVMSGGAGGSSPRGGPGGSGGTRNVADGGRGPGGGGSGGSNTNTGGGGAAGGIFVRWY